MTASALLSPNTACAVLIFTIFTFRQFYLATSLVPCLFNPSPCTRLSTQRHISERLIFFPALFITKQGLQPQFFVPHCLYTEVSLLSSSKGESPILAVCAFEKTASFRTQLSTYGRRFITSVEHEISAGHEFSDLSTEVCLSLSTVYYLMSMCGLTHNLQACARTKSELSTPGDPEVVSLFFKDLIGSPKLTRSQLAGRFDKI